MSSSRSRTSPYVLDDLFAQVHHTAAGILWRWRTELAALMALTAALAALWRVMQFWQAAAILGALLAVALAVPHSRKILLNRVWCVLARHRLHRLFWNEPRLHTRTGRIPLIIWIRPTKVGVRAHVLCRAGICHKDFTDNAPQIASACFAREARVTHSPRWSHLITIDIIRHDPLGASRIIPSPLLTVPARHQAAKAIPARAEVPATRQADTTTPAVQAVVIPFPNRRNPRQPA
jgi:hypothetical protein